MSAQSQTVPPNEVVEAFVTGVVVPTLNKVAEDAARVLNVKTELVADGGALPLHELTIGEGDVPLDTSVRLYFRGAFGGRYLLFCEALFPREQAVRNCSGFTLKADCRPGHPPKRTAWTMRYSVWHWTGWK